MLIVKEDFAPYLGSGKKETGSASGEEFRELILSLLKNSNKILIDFRGIITFSGSFLREAFSGLERNKFEFIFEDGFEYIEDQINHYLK